MPRKTPKPIPDRPNQTERDYGLSVTPFRVTAEKLAGWTGANTATIRTILGPLGIGGTDGYDVMRAIPALLNHYRTISEKSTRASQDAIARRNEADASSSELDLEVKLGKLCSRDELRRLLEGVVVKAREDVRAMPGLTLDQKKAVCLIVAKMVLPVTGEEASE